MFTSLSDRLRLTLQTLSGQGQLTHENTKAAFEDVRRSLLEADVALSVAEQFVDRIREQATGQDVASHLNPAQALFKIVQDELTRILGAENSQLNLSARPPAVVLMAGLQGVGKTTTAVKLCHYLMRQSKRQVMVVSTDIYRPGAIDQLEVLAEQSEATFFRSTEDKPVAIARAAVDAARRQVQDVLVIDTAGRLALDDEMMAEISALHKAVTPVETLFVVDAMTGQDAATTAKAFGATLPLTGVVLAKVDGDSRGGAALSVREVTGCPIKFLATGEKIDAFEPFHPDRIASRILGMGDVASLIEEVEAKVERKKADRLTKKIRKGQKFNLYDFRDQLNQLDAMGGAASLMAKMPGMRVPDTADKQIADDANNRQMKAIINSMTHKERRRPEIITGSRKRRVAAGSGTQIQDVNRLLKRHKMMHKMTKKMKSPAGLKRMSDQLSAMSGGAPGASGGRPFLRRR